MLTELQMGIYIMLPIAIMYYVGHPDFYNQKVRPVVVPQLAGRS
jgi:hypothetical protein